MNEDAEGWAWSCVHVPGAEDFAAGIDADDVGEITVDGDVVCVEMELTPSGDTRLPAAAPHALSAAILMSPGF